MTCHNIFLASKTLRKLYREYYRYMYLMLILDLVDNIDNILLLYSWCNIINLGITKYPNLHA